MFEFDLRILPDIIQNNDKSKNITSENFNY